MSDHELADLLERSADRVSVSQPPLADIRNAACRTRRRRAALGGVVAVAAVAAVIGGAALAPSRSTDPGQRDPRPPAAAGNGDPAPPGTRLVGIGRTAIAVPEDWGTNQVQCGAATRPTVVIDMPVRPACGLSSPRLFDSVWIEPGVNRSLFVPVEDVEIDGVTARRDEVSCDATGVGRGRLCTGTVYLPSEDASYQAQATSAPRVREILSWIRVLANGVAVPGFAGFDLDHQDADAGAHYRAALEDAGLRVEVTTEPRPGAKAGYVLDVEPAPGTVLAPGDVVRMTEVADPRGPADEVSIEVNSLGPGDNMDYRGRTDQQIRAGTTLRVDLGATVWVFGQGSRIGTLTGTLAGSSLVPDDAPGPNRGRIWRAMARGTTTLLISIVADGQPVRLGSVTVVVR
ncbi:PASTA domain-containing protein [Nocardioides sp. KIGAM211]|uniref:PASTA domain-containing protein n=1 Tax=Nocardioides luti TaxID=2761101 RepID=A0A7X0RJF7_9ACTN|nr:PASTA domain-containing protein [Nocardioides luti]MBB6629392.1 PASTA domain-containing protein [Nocardioides luti]